MGPWVHKQNLWGFGFIKSWYEKQESISGEPFILPVVAESFSLEMSLDDLDGPFFV